VPSTKIIFTRHKPVAPTKSKHAGTGGLSNKRASLFFLRLALCC